MATSTEPSDRRSRRRAQTRSRLVGAARELFAEQGVDATRINEITERADVGFGSFYNYFADKDAVVESVLEEEAEAQGATVDALTADLEDPAEVVSVAHRHFVRLAATDPAWGWLVVRLDASHRVLVRTLGGRAARDLDRGIAAGRFDVPDPEVMLMALGGALIGTMRVVLDGHRTAGGADVAHAEGVLRMLGLPPAEAAEIARRGLPEV